MKRVFYIFYIGLLLIVATACKDNSTEPAENQSFNQADGIKGGILYDKFWAVEANYSKSSDANLLSKLNTYSDFFRCKQCHGWDLLGSNGSYNNRGPKTNRPNVSALNLLTMVKTKSAQELFEGIKKTSGRRDISYDLSTYNPTSNNTVGDQMPNYSQLLSDSEIWDLVKFLKNEVIDVTNLYDASYTGVYPTGKAVFSNIGKDGNATNGKTYYNNKCSVCHGSDGKTLLMESMTLGKFLRTKPNETQHKVKFGQLGSSMSASRTTLQQMKDLYKAVADTTAFPNK